MWTRRVVRAHDQAVLFVAIRFPLAREVQASVLTLDYRESIHLGNCCEDLPTVSNDSPSHPIPSRASLCPEEVRLIAAVRAATQAPVDTILASRSEPIYSIRQWFSNLDRERHFRRSFLVPESRYGPAHIPRAARVAAMD